MFTRSLIELGENWLSSASSHDVQSDFGKNIMSINNYVLRWGRNRCNPIYYSVPCDYFLEGKILEEAVDENSSFTCSF